MPYLKRLVMKGFKSFASQTEVPFTNGMNVFVGPNGSGKSNVTDAICFVLGRLSAKSIRAEKTSNLIFAGTKFRKPEHEASVSLVFDNSDKILPIEAQEIEIERIVRRNGQGIYKINQEVKTRQEILELLAQAGIDPHGFNIVLQGNITDFVKMSAEERRQVIEEVAGISVYESRKEKSLHEMEKTEMKLKEVNAILRERSSYLRNLEEERQQALHFKKLEETVKRCKATILSKMLDEKKKEISSFDGKIQSLYEKKQKQKTEALAIESEISSLSQSSQSIQSHITKSTGVHQEQIREEITQLRAGLSGLTVKRENLKLRLIELGKRRDNAIKEAGEIEKEILELKKSSPIISQKQEMLKKKREQLLKLEDERKQFYALRTNFSSIKERLLDRKKQLQKVKQESDFALQEIEKDSFKVSSENPLSCQREITALETKKESVQKEIYEIDSKKSQENTNLSILKSKIDEHKRIKGEVSKIDICPLCKTKITAEHIGHVTSQADKFISEINSQISALYSDLNILSSGLEEKKHSFSDIDSKLISKKIELVKLQGIESRKTQLKRLMHDEEALQKEIAELEKKQASLEQSIAQSQEIGGKYEQTVLELQEISSRSEENIDTTINFKERDLEATKQIIRQTSEDNEEMASDISALEEQISLDEASLEKKEEEERILISRFQKLLDEKNDIQKKIQEMNSSMMQKQHDIGETERLANDLKVEKARLDAERENLELDFSSYSGIEPLEGSLNFIKERLDKSQQALQSIGSVNLRALEVYEAIKAEYDAVREKSEKIELEKTEILKIIEEIDAKKRKVYIHTLKDINELFKRNFSQLSAKGEVFLTIEDEENPFDAGLGITVKLGKGKYFDVTSLSGGEQTLVALSLIFAIQEYKPYPFYIFDEVDAALDKRNSERLAGLIKRHMTSGQYIIVTHNDALITEAPLLYGVTMQDGLSKIISLKV